ncbi:hypothetical protein CHCC20488_4516 [Bacillus paralicheniformis]|nr:hypothetical protein CHCC20497_3038 [Bacillus paralicheniformis]TWN43111.1 hypothetical protein CHCC14523_1207 [Bacillus paralicheniformis]TWN85294.1 hypothetical protein CHCC20492_0553 [Bacillus paralicheniformis]TWO08505.1 hypothetical protein CHCC20488_4516 [Bacillus paralicheniformis]
MFSTGAAFILNYETLSIASPKSIKKNLMSGISGILPGRFI